MTGNPYEKRSSGLFLYFHETKKSPHRTQLSLLAYIRPTGRSDKMKARNW